MDDDDLFDSVGRTVGKGYDGIDPLEFGQRMYEEDRKRKQREWEKEDKNTFFKNWCIAYLQDDDTLTIKNYIKFGSNDVVIPSEIRGKRVKTIADAVFYEKGLTSVIIPESVDKIGHFAFKGNKDLTSVTILSKNISISVTAFEKCPNIKTVNTKDSRVSDSFYTPGIKFNYIDETEADKKAREWREAEKAKQRKKISFIVLTVILAIIAIIVYRSTGSFFKYQYNDQGTLTITKYSGKKQVVIPASNRDISVTEIGKKAFYNKKITSVIIPSGITVIGDSAFFGNRLSDIIIPDSVTTIGEEAFSGNSKLHRDQFIYPTGKGNILTTLILPDSVTFIGKSAFAYNQLSNIIIPDSIITIEPLVFFCNLLVNVNIPASVTTIGEQAFALNPLTSITIGANVKLNPDEGSFGEFGFVANYNDSGKRAGTYTRPDARSRTWTMR